MYIRAGAGTYCVKVLLRHFLVRKHDLEFSFVYNDKFHSGCSFPLRSCGVMNVVFGTSAAIHAGLP